MRSLTLTVDVAAVLIFLLAFVTRAAPTGRKQESQDERPFIPPVIPSPPPTVPGTIPSSSSSPNLSLTHRRSASLHLDPPFLNKADAFKVIDLPAVESPNGEEKDVIPRESAAGNTSGNNDTPGSSEGAHRQLKKKKSVRWKQKLEEVEIVPHRSDIVHHREETPESSDAGSTPSGASNSSPELSKSRAADTDAGTEASTSRLRVPHHDSATSSATSTSTSTSVDGKNPATRRRQYSDSDSDSDEALRNPGRTPIPIYQDMLTQRRQDQDSDSGDELRSPARVPLPIYKGMPAALERKQSAVYSNMPPPPGQAPQAAPDKGQISTNYSNMPPKPGMPPVPEMPRVPGMPPIPGPGVETARPRPPRSQRPPSQGMIRSTSPVLSTAAAYGSDDESQKFKEIQEQRHGRNEATTADNKHSSRSHSKGESSRKGGEAVGVLSPSHSTASRTSDSSRTVPPSYSSQGGISPAPPYPQQLSPGIGRSQSTSPQFLSGGSVRQLMATPASVNTGKPTRTTTGQEGSASGSGSGGSPSLAATTDSDQFTWHGRTDSKLKPPRRTWKERQENSGAS